MNLDKKESKDNITKNMEQPKYGKYQFQTMDDYALLGMLIGLSIGSVINCVKSDHSTSMSFGMIFGMIIGINIKVKVSTTSTDYLKHMALMVNKQKDIESFLVETTYIDYSDEMIKEQTNKLVNQVQEEFRNKYGDKAKFIFYMFEHLEPQDFTKLDKVNAVQQECFLHYENIEDNKKRKKEFRNYKKIVYKGLKEYEYQLVQTIYEFVRDDISHSKDIDTNLCCAKASEVLREKTGICHAKANLLAAMLRLNKIPCGLVYQHLTLGDDDTAGYVLHCFNAAYVCGQFIFLDAHGNKEGVDAQFDVNNVKLAFPCREEYDEYFCYGIYEDAHLATMRVLENAKNLQEAYKRFPEYLEDKI